MHLPQLAHILIPAVPTLHFPQEPALPLIPSHWCATGVTALGFQLAEGWGYLLDFFLVFFFLICELNVGLFY